MSRSKRVFAGMAVLFLLLLFYASYDISTRTHFPGSKPQKNQIRDTSRVDSVKIDSTRVNFYK